MGLFKSNGEPNIRRIAAMGPMSVSDAMDVWERVLVRTAYRLKSRIEGRPAVEVRTTVAEFDVEEFLDATLEGGLAFDFSTTVAEFDKTASAMLVDPDFRVTFARARASLRTQMPGLDVFMIHRMYVAVTEGYDPHGLYDAAFMHDYMEARYQATLGRGPLAHVL